MADLATEIRVFLSSTFVDLREVRAQVSYRLRQIFGVLEAISKPPFGHSNLLILNGLNRVLKSALIKRRHLSGGRSEHILGGNHAYTSGLHPASSGYRKVGVCHSRMRFANSFHGREITLDVSHPWWYAP